MRGNDIPVLERTTSFVINQFLSAVLCLSAAAASSSLLFLLVLGVGERRAAVVDHGAGQIHLDGEDVRLLQDGVALVVVTRHAGDEALQLEHDVLD